MNRNLKPLWPLAVVLLLAALSFGRGNSSDNILANHQLKALTQISFR